MIRGATEADLPEILAMICELAEYENAIHEVQADLPDLKRALFADDPKVFAEIVEEDGQILGFAIWFLNFSTWQGRHGIYLEDLYIRPAARGKGFGKALLVHLANLCQKNNWGRLQWWVLDWNSPAIEFYRSLGAVAMDEWTVHRVSGDALINLAAKG
jgi:GNAT superfamily N-acetyltransferase